MSPESKILGALVVAAIGGFLLSRPRGIRNNNPGNLIDAGIPWRGLVGRDATGKAQFATAIDGLRAMYIDLRTGFQRDGEDTVREIITEWSATDREPYIAFVSNWLGVHPDTPLDLATVRVPLMKAITHFENGQQPYPDAMILRAIAEA
jgi:hypothetical protein